jgi:hypothetical protein
MNVKKNISFILALFLLVCNTGFTIDVHYCGDKIAFINPILFKNSNAIIQQEITCCSRKAKDSINKKASCCKDKLVHFQKKSGKVPLNPISFQSDIFFLVAEWGSIIISKVSNFESISITTFYCNANAPPLYKLYHQYIFYALF